MVVTALTQRSREFSRELTGPGTTDEAAATATEGMETGAGGAEAGGAAAWFLTSGRTSRP